MHDMPQSGKLGGSLPSAESGGSALTLPQLQLLDVALSGSTNSDIQVASECDTVDTGLSLADYSVSESLLSEASSSQNTPQSVLSPPSLCTDLQPDSATKAEMEAPVGVEEPADWVAPIKQRSKEQLEEIAAEIRRARSSPRMLAVRLLA